MSKEQEEFTRAKPVAAAVLVHLRGEGYTEKQVDKFGMKNL